MMIMKIRFTSAHAGLLALSVGMCLAAPALAQQGATDGAKNLTQPVYRVQRQDRVAAATSQNTLAAAAAPAQAEHPLVPALQLAKNALVNIDNNVTDYTATLMKRENIDGKLGELEYIHLKVRNKPFSAYMYFLGPNEVKGRECLYVDGQYNNKLIAHEGKASFIKRPFHLDPVGMLAMRGQRYPITEVGIRNLTARLIEVAENDMKIGGECEVKWYKGTKIGKGEKARTCTCLQVIHPVKRPGYRFHQALVFIDDELQVPIRYQAFQWPKTAGGQPVLDEEYTYMDLKLNPGLTDTDFSKDNQAYRLK